MPLDIDRDLVERAKSGGSALERLIEEVWPEAYRVSVGVLHDFGLAEDAAQDACVAIVRGLPTLKNVEAFRAWSYKTIVNCAVSTLRRRPQTRPLDPDVDRGISLDRSDAIDLHRALALLPVRQRAAIVLHYYVGLPSGDIARAMGMPSSTIRFYLVLARRALQKSLGDVDRQRAPRSKEVLPHAH